MDSHTQDDTEGMQNQVGKIDKYFKWPREMDLLLLDLLKNEKAKGNKDEKRFNKKAWDTVIVILNTEFNKMGKNIDRTKAVNRLKTIQKLMFLGIELLDKKSGFGWNDTTKKIEATNSVWESVIQVKPDFKLVRDKELYFLEDARELFEKDRATGDGSVSAKEQVRRWHEQQDGMTHDHVDMDLNTDNFFDHVDHFMPFNSVSPGTQSSPNNFETASLGGGSGKASSKGTKRKKKESVTEEISKMTTSIDKLTSVIENSNQRVFRASEVLEELGKMNLDDYDTMKAMDFLLDNNHLVDRFFALREELKYPWLINKMAGGSNSGSSAGRGDGGRGYSGTSSDLGF